MNNLELIRPIVRVGNSAGVILPKEWLSGKAKIELLSKPLNIKKDILEILDKELGNIIGIYLCGSYARGEENDDSDIDILAISGSTRKNISSGKYNIEIYTLNGVKATLEHDYISIYPRLAEAKAIINNQLLEELKTVKATTRSIKFYLDSCKRIIKINKAFLNLNNDFDDKYLDDGTIYSLILRLRGVYMLKMIKKNVKYNNKGFISWLCDNLNIEKTEIISLYNDYRRVKEDKKTTNKHILKTGLELLDLLKKEVKFYEKK